MNLNDIFKEYGLIAQHLENFEFRPEQAQMANAVQEAIRLNRHLLAEVGTGVGKSLAYLIPFINWAVSFDKKVAVSTYTKTLQEQLVNKDLPFLQRVLGIEFKFALCVGGQNYLCLRRFNQAQKYDLFESDREMTEICRISKWLDKTETGLYSDLEFRPPEFTWAKICRESDLCMGKKCLYTKNCFYRRAKLKENNAHILVINHHLFFANLISGGRVLSNFEAVVFDEAHTLENVATEYLGIEITNLKIKYFLDSIFNPQSGKGFLNRIKMLNKGKADWLKVSLDAVRVAAGEFFLGLISKFGSEYRTQRVRTPGFMFNHLKEPLSNLCRLLAQALDDVKEPPDKVQIKSFISRGQEINSGLDVLINQSLEDYVYWIEILNRSRRPKYSLYAAPTDISAEFRQKVLDNFGLIVFTSATLSTNGDFEFFKKSLGIEDANELLLNSPFDYSRNALVYIPRALPDPSREPQSYQNEAIAEIKRILAIMKGRTFVLFTSYRMLDMANTILRRDLKDCNILRQGDAPRYKLLEKFKAGEHSVLLGTNTFWQGIDVPGRALECVIIAKLPFTVPDDPIIEAKMELLRAQNKDPFIHYQIPQAIIMLRQGFGRLIRRKSDIGMVAILDPRIQTRFYGKVFLGALPECQQASRLEKVEQFFLNSESVLC